MANGGAFLATPEQIMEAERQARAQGFGQAAGVQNPMLAGAVGNLGYDIASAIGGAFGAQMPQSNALKEAQAVQQITQGTDFSNRESVLQAARAASNAGFTNVASKLAAMAPAAPEPYTLSEGQGRYVGGELIAERAQAAKPQETFGGFQELFKSGNNVVIGQPSATGGQAANVRVVSTEEWDRLKAGGSGGGPQEITPQDLEVATNLVADMKLASLWGGNLSDESAQTAITTFAGAKRAALDAGYDEVQSQLLIRDLMTQTDSSGDPLYINDTVGSNRFEANKFLTDFKKRISGPATLPQNDDPLGIR